MSSVIGRVREVKQPSGGYIKPSQFEVDTIRDGLTLSEKENLHPAIIEMTVECLTRFVKGTRSVDAFGRAYKGAARAEKMYGQTGTLEKATRLLSEIKGLDDNSVVNACKVVTYDLWNRNPQRTIVVKGVDETDPNMETVNNIKMMVARSILFWNRYGPIIKYGFAFEPDGYTNTISTGYGNYITADTIWDFKVTRLEMDEKNTLQLLMYWIMGQHSGQELYKGIQKLGMFNPRLNEIYRLDIKDVSKETIAEVERDVICY